MHYGMVGDTKLRRVLVEASNVKGDAALKAREIFEGKMLKGFNVLSCNDGQLLVSYHQDDILTAMTISSSQEQTYLSDALLKMVKKFKEKYTVGDSEAKLKEFSKTILSIMDEFNREHTMTGKLEHEADKAYAQVAENRGTDALIQSGCWKGRTTSKASSRTPMRSMLLLIKLLNKPRTHEM